MFISKVNYIPKLVLHIFFQEISSYSLDLSCYMTSSLLPQPFSALFPTQMSAVRFEGNTNVNPY